MSSYRRYRRCVVVEQRTGVICVPDSEYPGLHQDVIAHTKNVMMLDTLEATMILLVRGRIQLPVCARREQHTDP